MAPLPGATNAVANQHDWLNKALFTDILRSDYSTYKIISFSANPANPKGENYASVLYRIKAKVENDKNGLAHRSFIVKVNHTTGFGTQLASSLGVFPKEIEMYTEIIPRFEDYFKKIGEVVKLGPRCLYAENEPHEIIVMDDIGLDGFKSADRMQGLDLDHCEIAIKKIAQFHAASAKYVEEVGKFSAKFDRGMFAKSENNVMEKSRDQFLGLLRMLMQGFKCDATLKHVFDNFHALLGERVHECTALKKDRFNVLCHGDLWSNNIMFKYSEEGKLEDCRLVDYQMCFYGSPVLDLQYFIFTSVQKDSKLSNIDYLLQFYHKHLVTNLKNLNYQHRLPMLLELQMEFLDCGAYGVLSTFTVFPVVTAPASADSDVDALMDAGERGLAAKKRVYTNPDYVAAMEELIPYFERKGYFEL